MYKRKVEFFIVDILIAYNKIKRYIAKFDNANDFLHSELQWDATIRELEIIAEATKHLIKQNILDKSYQMIVDFRNHINHEYFGIDENIVWDVVQNLIDEFLNDLKKIIQEQNINLDEVIEHSIIDYKYNNHIIEFLREFKNKQ